MRFSLPKEALVYYEKFNKGKWKILEDRLEFYWLCAIIGLLSSLDVGEIDSFEPNELTDKFTQRLSPSADGIRTLLFYFYYMRSNNSINEKEIMKSFDEFLTVDTLTKLSDKGTKEFNERAAIGFFIIKENDPEPNKGYSFLLSYLSLLDEMMEEYNINEEGKGDL